MKNSQADCGYNFLMDAIEIVKLSPDQWPAYQHIRLEALKNEPQAFSSSYITFSQKPDSYWQMRLAQAAEGTSGWLLFARPTPPAVTPSTPADPVVGMIGAFRIDEEPGVAEIVSVYVTPAWRGKGVGRALMTAIIQTLCQEGSFHTLRLGVSDSQINAQTLYRSLGFQLKDSLQAVLADGKVHQEYLMERPCNFSAPPA